MRRLLHFFWFDYHRRENDTALYEQSNLEFQKWGERCLEQRFDVHSTSCVKQGRVTRNPGDVLIGHLTWHPDHTTASRAGPSERNWVYDNRLGEGAACHPNTYILTPWVPVFPDAWTCSMPYYESQLDAAKLVFGVCGRIWYDATMALDDSTPQGRARRKLVRLDMCVNPDALGPTKSRFNPPGQRKVIHVSNLAAYKGIDVLLESTKGVTVPSIGSAELAQHPRGEQEFEVYGNRYKVRNLGRVDNTDHEAMRGLVEEHDFYLHTASMDAQATTTLEFGVRGLVPIVTRESGFESDAAIYLTRDANHNREIIAAALEMPEDELRERSARVRACIREKHSWRAFYATIADHIERTAES